MLKVVYYIAGSLLILASCTTEIDKKRKPIMRFERFLTPEIVLDSLPDTLGLHLYTFANHFQEHPSSEQYLYAATLLAERSSHRFDAARWCESFIAHYPKSKRLKQATIGAAHNFEMTGNYEKAIKYYEMAAKQQGDSPLGKQCTQAVKMLKLGLITPEQQLEYMLNQNKQDSAK
jgi:TolA-binding protein